MRMMKTNISPLLNYLDEMFPSARCELFYSKDYELVIAVMLSAQTTDKSVNAVTPILFNKYPSFEVFNNAPLEDIEEILKTDIDPNSKAVYQYRLAKLYFYDNNRDKAKYYLNEAKNNTSDSNAKKKIDSILNGNWKHL